ncbi:glutathione S-transferase family protein [Acidaminobacter sp. JC074]|uniref:glutathione S-transferase family protein n=1 Tax=Acidaminobacter sp. JC074 TaxID=2530199 RepID=UPI001F0D4994|nr:glutathione S-transferase family protein [Acidaminobacter sp. JC074]MCH4887653.1 glutathione S-transferase family protein [Acidaminobacter sp. JC074]
MSIEILKENKLKDLKGIYLFGSTGSNNYLRSALMLEEKKLDWKQVQVNLLKYENFKPEYLKINPQGSIPAMIHDGLAIYGSENILKYIEKAFPNPTLTPEDESDMWEWVQSATRTHIETAIGILYKNKSGRPIRKDMIGKYKKHNPNKLNFIEKRGYHMTKAQEKEVLDINHAKLRMLDDQLKQSSYIMGDEISVADFAWAPDIVFLSTLGFDVSPYKNIERWLNDISQRDSWNKRTKLPKAGLKIGGYYLKMLSKSSKYMD